MCLYPTLWKNPKYKETKKNGGVIPTVYDKRTLYVPIGCDNCKECLKAKQTKWKTRLMEDIKYNTNAKFITLTFSNEEYTKLAKEIPETRKRMKYKAGKYIEEIIENKGYELDNQIATLAARRFNERWRKKFKKAIRHFFVTELGHNGTENIHLHGLIWTDELPDTIRDIWKYGYIWPRYNNWKGNYVNGDTIGYIGKYITKRDHKHKTYKPILLTSAGIGKDYVNSYNSKTNKYKDNGETQDYYTTKAGTKTALPIYYRNKIYTDEEREKLWLEKLDKQIRYVGGEKIDISKGTEEYFKTLKYYQEKNIELGYGDNKKDWEQSQYEKQQRELNQKKRMSSPDGR